MISACAKSSFNSFLTLSLIAHAHCATSIDHFSDLMADNAESPIVDTSRQLRIFARVCVLPRVVVTDDHFKQLPDELTLTKDKTIVGHFELLHCCARFE
jgi:hypothetical protein